ncbi:Alkaline phosphatase [Monaibacterium marinum]|uniref:Alkaline phosphatase n=1 Tax=Pontivivens marinum TaxID=1690039 RepID=A0A2C9CP83_9RHOB|nr:alkaline phosphatase [Monaibacterium marinum]SOH93144.1 Alkaline phosphatase [Monaibacterium marinum]
MRALVSFMLSAAMLTTGVSAQDAPVQVAQPIEGRTLNVILMVAEHVSPYEAVPNLALVKTYNINAQTPDSAPTAGAMNTGVEQRLNLINLGENAVHDDCSTQTDITTQLIAPMHTCTIDFAMSVSFRRYG